MSDPEIRDVHLAALATRLDALVARTGAAVAGLAPEAFSKTPPGGGWSIAQNFEHLCRTNEPYFGRMAAASAAAKAARGQGKLVRPWRPGLVGGFLARSLSEKNSNRRIPSPALFRPGTPRPNVTAAFLATLAHARRAICEADGLDLRVGLFSPVSPLIRMNLGDAFAILVAHGERHLGQIERTRRAIGA